ncbi:hypothetical protein GCM10022198_01470 [Klugiella xanthotipulae]|uniref:Putative repeat protein (TIGR01451 family)/fimbrial isopeptide formation D2 family protein n=1 Tax=Klugiella xanthotipulae TaxID=244735 RepID=A0A543I538_9MICO|nr:DUF11 domain-containing protein [Klugiella xanthotipulae]TQM65716.1 putative repeat protein (TIGR01451 family)/fimbrial isopeptide formation D2 family protein [Klugiella xanthotipulae]
MIDYTLNAARRWIGRTTAIAVVAALLVAALVSTPGTPAEATDGLSVTATPATIQKRLSAADPGFVITVTDEMATPSSSYILGGVPAGWSVTVAGTTLAPLSPDPILYSLVGTAARSGAVSLVPPVGFEGTVSGLQLSRVSTSAANLITDFDNGTFDYNGSASEPAQAKPVLPDLNTAYRYKDPTVLNASNGTCTSTQYGPCDGLYTIWPTANMGGSTSHFNNLWADLRSVGTPMTVNSATVCSANNSYQVPTATAEQAGKFLIINGSENMPVPNNLVVTTVTGLTPHTNYTFSGYLANLSYDSDPINPVRSALFAGNTLIGSSVNSPKQPSCNNAATTWTSMTSTVNTGSATSLTLGVRNMTIGGIGNDLGVDELSLYEMETATFAVTVKGFTAGLAVATSATPASGTAVSAGDYVTYSVSATNTGDATLTNVTLTDALADVLDNATVVAGSLAATTGAVPVISGKNLTWKGTLAPAESVTLTYQVLLGEEYRSGQSLVRGVVGSATDPAGGAVASGCTTGAETACSTVHPIIAGDPSLSIALQADSPSGQAVTRGSTVTYTVTASNTGETPLTGVTIRNDLADVLDDATIQDSSLAASTGPAPTRAGNLLTWTGPLGIGKSVTLTYAVVVKTDFAEATTLLNRATAEASDPNGGSVPATCVTDTGRGCLTTHPVPVAGVSIAKNDHTEIVGTGEDTTYDLVVTNTGEDRATGVTVTDSLPEELTFVSATKGGRYDPDTRTVRWDVGTIPVSGTQTVSVTATVDPALAPNHSISNTATVSSAEGCTAICSATDVDRTPAISVVVDDHREVVRSADVLTYDVVVANTGDGAVPGVVVTSILPPNTEFVSATGGGVPSEDGTTVTWTLGERGAHTTETLTVTVRVGSVSAGDSVVHNATVTSDHGCTNDPATPGDECGARDTDSVPAVSVTTDDHLTTAVPGGQNTYDVVVTNRMPGVAPRVTVTQVLSDDLTFVSADAHGTYDPTNRTVTWNLGDLPAGAQTTLHVTGTVAKGVLPNATVVATARVATDGTCADDITTVTNECESSDTDRVPAIGITVDDGLTIVRSGQTAVYTITARNDGDDEATEVMVRDTMPTNVDFVTSSITATQSIDNPLAFEWNVGTIAPGASVTITVTVRVHDDLPADTRVVNTASIATAGVCVDNPATPVAECVSVDTDRLPSDVWILLDDHLTVIAPAQELVYDIVVGNNSATNTVEAAEVTNTLPDNVTFVSASDGGELNAADGTVTWSLPRIAPGGTTTVQVTVTADKDIAPGAHVLSTALVQIPGGCSSPDACESFDLDGVADLGITLDDHRTQVDVDEQLTYDLVISNRSTVAASEVVARDQLPPTLTFVSATGGGTYDEKTREVTFELGELGAGADVTVQVVATVNAGGFGVVLNPATVTSAQGCTDTDACQASDTDLVQGLALTGSSPFPLGLAAVFLLASGVFLAMCNRRRGGGRVV